ncbi:hypothetical protein F2P45_08715 [Massilia sp. CCM 8733]|uniref:DUF3592 domain-containing protein n=1 Tax=Massilia mucilaginosa TaxID=2609282 RepID=A0ABX0NQT1_9BURK|nr:hypothetical protein [Massilia mucilaginosa]NHZ89098.1 hypothetical protein [Massilia mucilaginosa]
MKKYIFGFSLLLFFFGASTLLDDLDKRKAERRYREQGEVARVMAFKNMEERSEGSEGHTGKSASKGFAVADIEFRTQGGTRVAVAQWPISKELLEQIGNGERIEIEYLRDDPHTIRLPGKPYRGFGWMGYIVYIALTLSGAWLFFGLFRSRAHR